MLNLRQLVAIICIGMVLCANVCTDCVAQVNMESNAVQSLRELQSDSLLPLARVEDYLGHMEDCDSTVMAVIRNVAVTFGSVIDTSTPYVSTRINETCSAVVEFEDWNELLRSYGCEKQGGKRTEFSGKMYIDSVSGDFLKLVLKARDCEQSAVIRPSAQEAEKDLLQHEPFVTPDRMPLKGLLDVFCSYRGSFESAAEIVIIYRVTTFAYEDGNPATVWDCYLYRREPWDTDYGTYSSDQLSHNLMRLEVSASTGELIFIGLATGTK